MSKLLIQVANKNQPLVDKKPCHVTRQMQRACRTPNSALHVNLSLIPKTFPLMNWQHSIQMQPQEGTGNLDIQIKNHKGYRKRLADYVVQRHRSSTVTFMQNNMEHLFFCLSAPPPFFFFRVSPLKYYILNINKTKCKVPWVSASGWSEPILQAYWQKQKNKLERCCQREIWELTLSIQTLKSLRKMWLHPEGSLLSSKSFLYF